ncbi:PhnA domain-containing protein [Thalassotalea mangrovi]|uniref:PhnA domain protein n=1 Tax=Thalassotalea mangrovi TaxID=2572245 RepID=A0A4U1B6E3_9GAMM|nr:alkylphosphonate utilization protein [Thalassotalea mangrovi]TKB45481.1 PhnA domain protein [Thalassotalea mangrovi]
MSIEQTLKERSGCQCELCSGKDALSVYEVPPVAEPNSDKCILVCSQCLGDIDSTDGNYDVNHWRCLNDSMWSQVPAVQVMAYRMLKRLDSESWAQDLLDMIYLDDAVRNWAESAAGDAPQADEPTLDNNGAQLQVGDNVVLIKDLVVKGANFTAKRGTAVRNISLSQNPLHIEGRVNGTRIVIISDYVKKM